MNDEPRVWISSRKLRSGKRSYYLRWIDLATGKWRNQKVGTDRKRAERDATLLEDKLRQGTYQEVRSISWGDFAEDHAAKLPGDWNAKIARRTLTEFGDMMKPRGPRFVTFSMVERYAAELRGIKNKPETIRKKLRYLKAAMNRAIKRGYAVKNPVESELFPESKKKPPRIATDAEVNALLKSALSLYGEQWYAFAYLAVATGGRHSEIAGLTWDRVCLEGEPRVQYTGKSASDRFVPLKPETARLLLKLKARTLQDGGPFCGMSSNRNEQWRNIRDAAEVQAVTLHDLRRTCITRWIRAGMPLPTIKKLAGHCAIETTLKYYYWFGDEDMAAAAAKMPSVQVAG